MSDLPAAILVVEDDPAVGTFLADNLTADGYELHLAGSIHDARRVLEHRKPDLAILDLGLPDGSGLDLLRQVREADLTGLPIDAALPVLLLTGRAGELDRIRGFERGADDFLAKPFSYGELRGRVHALLRRCRIRTSVARLRAGDLEVDPVSREVLLRGERVALSQKEFALLRALAVEPGRVWTKEELLRDVWGYRSMGATRTLDSHACRLRHKLAVHGARYVVNVWGVGYRLTDGPVSP
jgi:DNA-binding response OmpR family regulator